MKREKKLNKKLLLSKCTIALLDSGMKKIVGGATEYINGCDPQTKPCPTRAEYCELPPTILTVG